MAWLGLVAGVGLALCGLWALTDAVTARWERSHPGDDVQRSRWRRVIVPVAAGLAALVLVGGLLVILIINGTGSSSGGGSGSGGGSSHAVNTSSATSSTTTTTAPSAARPLSQVHVEVLNASGVAKAASTKATALRALGYVIVGTGNAAVRRGSVVQCRAGFERDAAVLANNVAAGTGVESFPSPAPPGSENADCVVTLGK